MKDTARPIYNAYRNGMTVEALEKAMSYVPEAIRKHAPATEANIA
jgi:hypothetical protein